MDVIVLGLGVAGEHVAGTLAESGLQVLGIEDRLVGGECPYWGCIPSKMMIRAANSLAESRRVAGLSGHAMVTPDWGPVARRVREEATDNWNDAVAVERLVDKGGTFVRGRGRLVGPGRVQVDDTVYEADRIVLATGTRPVIPPIPGLSDVPFWTNREAMEADGLPDSLTVLGGGAIGTELAQMFARFGVSVTLVEGFDRVLALEEPESSEVALRALTSDGVIVHTGRRAVSVDGDSVHLDDGTTLTAERLLVATGRKANLFDIGLETVGLSPDARSIDVDDRMRAADGLWAVGDITGKGVFTHVAMYQAAVAIADILGRVEPRADYRAVPRVTFTDPEIGAVGLTEKQARERGIDIRVAITQMSEATRGWIHGGDNVGFIKLIVDAHRDVLIGATSAGPDGGEVLAGLAVAVQAEIPVNTLRHMMFAYPTFHRAIEAAVKALSY
ncbi:MAG: NAD(P)/FAD-dependent oxidoreductase [Longispora sp.]|nr:NAD(P)/FAD-dependent oxidoreductase [Longispora sp. (in: high G+C Gram-positive bacteria)]